jgi:hypothetical protein
MNFLGFGVVSGGKTARKSKAPLMNADEHRQRRNEERSFAALIMTNDGLAHAGYYYCYVVGLFGCAGPLFCGGY